MRIYFALCLLLLACGACNKDPSASMLMPDGHYSGTFQRNNMGHYGPVTHVSLQLNNGVFQGSSDSTYYPGVCNGNFSRKGNTIVFQNACFWPALAGIVILEGDYTVSQQNDSIRLVSAGDAPYANYITLQRQN